MATSPIQWDSTPDTSALKPSAVAPTPAGQIQWDSTPDTSALTSKQTGTSYQATPDESTPEGHAAAVAQREAQHPLLTAIGKGSGEALTDVWDTVKGMVTHPVDS